MVDTVIDVHEEHLQRDQFPECKNAIDYLESICDFSASEFATGYDQISIRSMFRIHTDSPRRFLILQKNPNLDKRWCKDNVHKSHRFLETQKGSGVRSNIDHSRTTLPTYLRDAGGDSLKILLHSVAGMYPDVDWDFDTIIDQQEFEKYLGVQTASEYEHDIDSSIIGSDDGFFGDFAYTNVCKFQASGSKGKPRDEDWNWLEAELAAINPEVIFAMGNTAINSLKKLGFKRTYQSKYGNKNEGKVYEYSGDVSALNDALVVRLYHLNYGKKRYGDVLFDTLEYVQSES